MTLAGTDGATLIVALLTLITIAALLANIWSK